MHSSPLKNAALRLSEAIQAHQNRKKESEEDNEIGWPRFRSWQAVGFLFFFDEPNKGFKVLEDTLLLSLGMGDEGNDNPLSFILKEAYLLNNQSIRNLRMLKTAGIYYAVFTVQELLAQKPIKHVHSS